MTVFSSRLTTSSMQVSQVSPLLAVTTIGAAVQFLGEVGDSLSGELRTP